MYKLCFFLLISIISINCNKSTINKKLKLNNQYSKKELYKGFPIFKTEKERIDIKQKNKFLSFITITTLKRIKEPIEIKYLVDSKLSFESEIDKIEFYSKNGDNFKFYLLFKGEYTLLEIKLIKIKTKNLKFETKAKNFKILYEDNYIKNEYLAELRNKYKINSLIKNTKSDKEKSLKVMNWVHNQWQHSGLNEPKKNDALSILQEVKNEGKNFRCVEYGIVTSATLNSIGLKARVLSLKTEDVETRKSGAGHVVAEVYLNDIKKWAFIDPQFNIMVELDNTPLNALELQKNIVNNYDKLIIKSLSSDYDKDSYLAWIYEYLFHFNIPIDNRVGDLNSNYKINNKSSLMLVPLKVKNPTIFQINNKIDYCNYTNNINDFYSAP
jgi:hypothetical protein